MQWFYAIDGKRLGPVSAEQFSNLVANGTVTESSLVWREGFADWQAWGSVAAENPLPPADNVAPPLPTATGGDDAESTSDGPELNWSIDEFSEQLNRNGFATSVGGCLTRAWENYKSFFGLALGAVLVAYLLSMVAGMLPIVGMFAGFLFTPHINAGAAWIFLKRARGEDVEFSDVFAGFSRCYVKLMLVGLIQLVAVFVLAMAFVVPMLALGIPLAEMDPANPPQIEPAALGAMGAIGFCLFLVVVYVSARFFLSHIVAIDRSDTAINAFKLSWRITRGRFWTIVGLALIMILLSVAGTLALFIGLIFVMPIYGAVIAQLYHDACESAAGRPPE